MTIRAPVPDLAAGQRTLGRDVSHYLCRVLRLRNGDTFVAFDSSAKTEAEASIVNADPSGAVIAIGEITPARAVATTQVVLVYALAKGDKVDAVVRDATELGATRIIVARTARSVVKIEGEGGPKLDRWRRVAEQAARQCGRADPPAVEGVLDWDAALAAATSETNICLSPDASLPLGAVLPGALSASVTFAIGPEGGLTEAELGVADTHGFRRAHLGKLVLRTETVASAVLGAVRILSP